MIHDARGEPRTRYGYTQNLEEKYILQYARGTRFLDIGAYDGETLSSTRALVNKGWSGVYVEPNPSILDTLRKNAEISKSEVLPVAIGTTCGTLPFYVTDDLVSSLDKDHVEKWEKNAGIVFKQIDVEVMDIQSLANKIGYHYDMLNLDVEGLNWETFKQFDWSKWKFNVVCIEYDDKFTEIRNRLETVGFRLVYISPENIVAVR
jgi:FkbM family methyltransferase